MIRLALLCLLTVCQGQRSPFLVSPISSKWFVPVNRVSISSEPHYSYANDDIHLDAWKTIPIVVPINNDQILLDVEGSGDGPDDLPNPVKHILNDSLSIKKRKMKPKIIDDNSEELFGEESESQKDNVKTDHAIDVAPVNFEDTKDWSPVEPVYHNSKVLVDSINNNKIQEVIVQPEPIAEPESKLEPAKITQSVNEIEPTIVRSKIEKLNIEEVMENSAYKFPADLSLQSSFEVIIDKESSLDSSSDCYPSPCCNLDTRAVSSSAWLSPLRRAPIERAMPYGSDNYPTNTTLAINVSACFPLAVEHTRGCMEIAFGGVYGIKCFNGYFRHVMYPSMRIESINCGPCR